MSLQSYSEVDYRGQKADTFWMIADELPSKAEKKSRSPIAKLPRGVAVFRTVNGDGREYWRVRLNKKFTGGKVLKKNFSTVDAARSWIFGDGRGESQTNEFKAVELGQEAIRNQLGAAAFDLTSAQLGEAQNAFKRLGAVKRSLTEAVDYFFKHALPAGGVRTFTQIAAEFIQHRRSFKDCKPRTIVQYESYFKVINEEFGDAKLSEMKRADIEDWLGEAEWSPRTRKNYLVTLTTVFNFAMNRDYCAVNAAASIERPILDDKPPGILTVEQATALLGKAIETCPEMIAGVAIGLFAGLRRSEICALDWSEIDLQARTLVVQGTKAKTRKRRVVTISDNLLAWLKPLARKAGPVAPSVDAFGEKLKQLAEVAEIAPWPHNALRHSFGSFFYAQSKNENLTAAEMGNTPQMVFKHYRALVKAKEVVLFWKIQPPKDYRKAALEYVAQVGANEADLAKAA
jgi:integrase